MINPQELSYWAGVFDFAGSIRWRKSRGRHLPCINLGSKNIQLLEQVKTLFGGSIRDEGPYHRWETGGTNAVRVITILYPHLRVGIDVSLLFWKASKRGPKAKAVPSKARQICFSGELLKP